MRVRGEERLIGEALLEQEAVDRERHGEVGARPHGQVQVGRLRDGRGPRVDDDERRAVLARLARNGIRWMPEADGFMPQSTISRACG